MLDRGRILWRVGYHSDPLGYSPTPQYNHRFDDAREQFRSMYAADFQETALREILTDFRPNTSAIAAYISVFGPAARGDIPTSPITARWRRNNVLIPVYLNLEGPLLDLTDHTVLRDIERYHAPTLAAAGMQHLDLHEITTRLRSVTQQIARDAYERLGASGIKFPSSRDGNACFAVFEGRGQLVAAGQPVRLTDPAPESLQKVAAAWELTLETAAPAAKTAP